MMVDYGPGPITHHEDCWRSRSHWRCAVARVERLDGELEKCREKLVACKRRNAELEARKEHASKLLQYVGIIKNEDVQEKIDEAFQVLNSRRLNTYLGELIESALAEGYNQGQTEERERCRARIIRLTTQRNRLLKAITVVVNSVGMDSDMRIVKTLNQTVQEVREAVADDN